MNRRTPLEQALHDLNEAAYAAASLARKAASPKADELKRIALATDSILEQAE